MEAGSEEVDNTRCKEFTETSPLKERSTAWNALLYISGAVASAANLPFNVQAKYILTLYEPMTLLKMDGTAGGGGVVTGLGAALQGSRPSYVELERGLLSSTKLAPKFVLYRTPGRGALNIVQTNVFVNN